MTTIHQTDGVFLSKSPGDGFGLRVDLECLFFGAAIADADTDGLWVLRQGCEAPAQAGCLDEGSKGYQASFSDAVLEGLARSCLFFGELEANQ